jgi:hypothetical protein
MSYNIKIEEKKGPRSSPYNDSEYYQYYFKMPNKDGKITEYMVELSKSPHHDNDNYNIFVRQENREYMYINPTAQYQVNSLPFTLEEAKKAVKAYELKTTLSSGTLKTFEDIIDEL